MFLIPKIPVSGLLRIDRTVDRARGRSTGRSTDAHKHARLVWLEGRSTDPIDHQRALLSGSGPGRPGSRPARELCSLDPASVDRAVDRWHNGRKSDHWPVDRAVDRQQNQLQI